MMGPSKFVRVVAPHFVAGIEINARGRCVEAAPILRWCKGKHEDVLREVFQNRGWRATVIDPLTHEVQL